MPAMARMTRATLVAIALAGSAFGIAMLAHGAEQNDTQVVPVALDTSDPERRRIGDLVYMGGIDIPAMDQNIGGLSALRWDAESRRLLAITDDARWVWLNPTELNERLMGLGGVEVGPLLGMDGEPLTGKEDGDSESLTRSAKGGWLIGFERNHRIWRYPSLSHKPEATAYDPVTLLGELTDNNGVEAMASGGMVLIVCAERQADESSANCRMVGPRSTADSVALEMVPPDVIAELGGVPTDIDYLFRTDLVDAESDPATGMYTLFRSWSPAEGNGAAIMQHSPLEGWRTLAVLRPPLTVDNFEGLAVRQEGSGNDRRTFLYIVSDDNFSSLQRTLLMKFEVLPEK